MISGGLLQDTTQLEVNRLMTWTPHHFQLALRQHTLTRHSSRRSLRTLLTRPVSLHPLPLHQTTPHRYHPSVAATVV